jgi:hypothetical protein
LDREIELVKTNQSNLQNDTERMVKIALGHEAELYFKPGELNANFVVIAALPAIQGNEVVMAQMKLWRENNARLTTMQRDLIRLRGWRFWLYFGRV